MANYLYGYKPGYRVAPSVTGGSSSPESASSSLFKSKTAALASSIYQLSSRDPRGVGRSASAAYSWDTTSDSDPLLSLSSLKRSSQALYHPSIYGAQSTIGQSEALYTSNSLSKRPRAESASNLPIYPQRPGEKDCAHYMLTRTCKFGYSCRFDHPIWVPEGGIPDWKEVPLPYTPESFPERPGEPDCPYFMKTQRCSFGLRCRFNHPKDKSSTLGASESSTGSPLPERPLEPPCAFYMKTGNCKFGTTCKFHHPKDFKVPQTLQDNADEELKYSLNGMRGLNGNGKNVQPPVTFSPALLHNSKGLPIRPGEVDCPFYLKTGSCKYGSTCCYNHPDWNAINPVAVAANMSVVPAASIYQVVDALSGLTTIYPQRPGQMECDYYMKTGECKFGERCKFHHPLDRTAQSHKVANGNQEVKLTLAGLPRREGVTNCPYYMKTGTCKYGATCKFDHPPPGEVIANAVAASQQGTSSFTALD
ncbi:hypothetical protein SAY86_029238 [Trapa natans]|uniref:C3H1-type domain-containing protein n=1 Tax=Trapa natans TaxID=22666 RepID=A0AAN7ME57_TRANT|nr:hypothetical protein SAY86_029238 [Trapa natans]